MSSRGIEIAVGLFVALGLGALFFVAMKVSNLSDLQTSEGYVIRAKFENAGSLKVRSPVSIAGVRVGRVSAIKFDQSTFQAIVEMRIEPAFDHIPEDTTASILTAGLLGEQYVGLSPGGSDIHLTDGGEIEFTQSAFVLEQVIGKFLLNKVETAPAPAPTGGTTPTTGAQTAEPKPSE